ncbi:piggyBac transposable element-derived protein 4-like [Watersipora subatra]|uniref:piggyBac transposable element-derived protein 4-like n=1 Tax=Watersipora subatra TaxID=2589382 RepID=UPI00355B6A8D
MAATRKTSRRSMEDIFQEIINDSGSEVESDSDSDEESDENADPVIPTVSATGDGVSLVSTRRGRGRGFHAHGRSHGTRSNARRGVRSTRGWAGRAAAEFVWVNPSPRHLDRFDGSTSGLNTSELAPGCSIMNSFRAIYDRTFFQLLKGEINRYANQTLTDTDRKIWKPITFDDLHQFFAMVIHMCLVHKPTIDDYFSTNAVMHSTFPNAIGLGRDKFKRILRYLHLNDNENYARRGDSNHDPLYKIKSFYDHLIPKFGSLYKPGASITVDEAICPFHGRVHFRVYMKNKPNKYGLRVECVCESTSGIVCNMEVYTATGDNTVEALLTRVLGPFSIKGHRVFMDRRYSSSVIFKKLREMDFYPVGTVNKNRKHLPIEFKNKKLKKGERITKQCGDILATMWKDVRDVYTLSTVDEDAMINTNTQGPRYGNHETLKPASVVTYNKNKAGVDKHDQMASYYPFIRRQMK